MKKIYAPNGASNYHNSAPITLIFTGETESVYGEDDCYIISAGQAKRINKHFCGISGCQCAQGGTIDLGQNHCIRIAFCEEG